MARAATGLPFDDIRRLIDGPPLPDIEAGDKVRAATAGLGRLGETAEWLAAWQGKSTPAITQPLVAVFAANHKIVERGVSHEPMSATQDIVELVAAGGKPVSRAAMQSNVGLKVFDLALDLPTPDIVEADALDEAACAATMAFGMEAIAGGADLLCVSDIGIGNRTVAAALAMALFGGMPSDWLPDMEEKALWETQHEAVKLAVARLGIGQHKQLRDPLEIMRRVGGREFAAIAGAVVAARYQRIPVLLDGMVAVTAAAVLHELGPNMVAHCRVTDSGADKGLSNLLTYLKMEPLLKVGLAENHGLGGILAIDLCRTAVIAVQP
ncbi:MAG: nicotinate-nucleotide--dimethylbenzimidazole phosphoribosyltransferase [Parvibaculum sp.]